MVALTRLANTREFWNRRRILLAGTIAAVHSVWDAIWPMAVAGALSPTITVVVLAILMRPNRPRLHAFAFWCGAVLAMLVWAMLVSSAMWGLVTDTERDLQRFSKVIDFVLAALLLAFALWRLLVKPRKDGESVINMSRLSEGGLWPMLAFGAVMQGRNVTSVLLFCAAQQHIDAAPLPLYQQVALTLVVIAIVTASSWIPILLPIRATDKLHSRLSPARIWLSDHTKMIEVGAALLGSAYLFARAVS